MARDLRLSKFEQTVTRIGDEQAHDIITFPGLAPILVQRDPVPVIVQQSGSARCFGARLVPPSPYGGDGVHLEQPQHTWTRDADGLHYWTRWSYVVAVSSADYSEEVNDALMLWPTDPVFIVPPAPEEGE